LNKTTNATTTSPISEDTVKNLLAAWLRRRGFRNVTVRAGTTPGNDVEAIAPTSGKRLVVECKGEAGTTRQRDRAWRNAAFALFEAIKKTEGHGKREDVAVAFPDTETYRGRMRRVREFCARQKIIVYWVSANGAVRRWRCRSTVDAGNGSPRGPKGGER
jgi:hypothetical protein